MLASNSLSAFSASNIQAPRAPNTAGPIRPVRDQGSAKQAVPAQAGTSFRPGGTQPAPAANLPRGSLLNLSV